MSPNNKNKNQSQKSTPKPSTQNTQGLEGGCQNQSWGGTPRCLDFTHTPFQ